MNEKKKPQDNSTAKIIFAITGVIILAFLLSVGSCIYKVVKNPKTIELIKSVQATDAEITEYRDFLNMQEEFRLQEAKKYEEIIPEEIREMKFDNHIEAGQAYFEMYNSQDWSSLDKEKQKLGAAYLAYGNYYVAVAARLAFLNTMSIPNVSKVMVKTLMDNDAVYQEFKGAQQPAPESEK